jgi:tetratricopeptide (TPR) repeat protein
LASCVLAAAGAVATAGAVAAAQSEQSRPIPVRYREPIQLYSVGLGKFSRKISSSNPEAQAFFNQGFQMMYSFAKPEAVRSFRAAWKADPECAICYWGEAWAWGSYLNAPMTSEESPFAYEAIHKAIALKSHATQVERDFIDAMTVRYVENFDASKRVEQDRAYAESTRIVSEKYPKDLEAATLYGEALFLLEPRRGTRALDNPNVIRLHAVLEKVLAVDDHHPGACHLYVHATESTVRPQKAEACAQFLGQSIPGASHMNHMPSHTWNRVGRWGDSVRANLEAWHTDQKAAIGEGFAIYPEHNLHMLLYAASYDGQGAIAIQAAKDYAKLTKDTFYQVLTLVRFGRFDEVAAVTTRPAAEVPGAMWDFGQGYAKLRNGDAAGARELAAKVLKTAEETKASFRTHAGKNLLGTVGHILEGEIARADKNLDAAIKSFERAVEFEDAMDYDEPEPLPFAARHWLGAALIEAGRFAEAEKAYKTELEDHPHNGWSLIGLKQALQGQKKSTAEVDADLASSWARSDTWLRWSRF